MSTKGRSGATCGSVSPLLLRTPPSTRKARNCSSPPQRSALSVFHTHGVNFGPPGSDRSSKSPRRRWRKSFERRRSLKKSSRQPLQLRFFGLTWFSGIGRKASEGLGQELKDGEDDKEDDDCDDHDNNHDFPQQACLVLIKNVVRKMGAWSQKRLLLPKLEDANWAGTAKSKECTLILTEGDSAKVVDMVKRRRN